MTSFIKPSSGTQPIMRATSRNWLSVLKNNERAIFTAAAHAQRVANYLHGPQAPPRDGRLLNPLARPRTDVNAGRLRGWLTAG